MNLKTRFLILIAGSFFIPNILIIITVFLSFGGVENMKSTHDLYKAYFNIHEFLENDAEREDAQRLLNDLPESMYAEILDEESIADKYRNMTQTNRENSISAAELFRINYTDGGSDVLLIRAPFTDRHTSFRSQPFPFIFILVSISVMTLLSLLIIRSIDKSLKRIEEAAGKVAEGNFEFELTAKGNDSIASLTRSFDTMRRKVKEEYDRRSRFFMGVSHDLKTPLASISGYADAVMEGYAEDQDTLNKYMKIIRSKSELLTKRISHLIHFVKLETGDWQATMETVRLKSFLEEIAESFAMEAVVNNNKFNFIIDVSEEIRVSMDMELVARSLENLLHNAYRYSYPETQISFRAESEGGTATIQIINSGEGIDKEELTHIFEPFYRGSGGRNDEGFGLGLANVSSVIKAHGWEIYAESELKKETSFTIKIPIIRE